MPSIEYLRSFKFGDYAIFDLTVSFLGVYLLAPLLSKLFHLIHLDIPRASWLLFTLPLSILVHILVGNYTPMTSAFLDPSSHYLLKIFIIVILVLGILGIKVIK